jgi:peptide/nickel transport system permease protein
MIRSGTDGYRQDALNNASLCSQAADIDDPRHGDHLAAGLHPGRSEDPHLNALNFQIPAGTAVAVALPDVLPEVRPRRGFAGLVRRYPTLAIGSAILLLMLFAAVFAPVLWTFDPTAIATRVRLREPSLLHWFGTDMLGRDIYSRVLYGARVSLVVGFAVAGLASVVGLAIGLIAGFVRLADSLIMRFMDGMMSIPPILLAVALMALTRGSIGNVVTAITVAEIPRVARLVRSVVLSLREQPYVDAAIAAGTRTPKIILKHILPNTLAPLIVQASYICASAMITEAILSFIGAGIPPSTPSWGNIMAEGRALWQVKFYIVLFPAAFLSLTVLAVNLVGDGLRDMLDPRMVKSA